MLELTVTNRKTGEKRDYKFAQNAILIGRQPNCDVILDATAVSRRHAKISINKTLIQLEDLGSGNGTFVNQAHLKSKDSTPLKADDVIRIEEFEITMRINNNTGVEPSITKVSGAAIPNPTAPDMPDADILEMKMIKKVLGVMEQDKQPTVIVIDDEFKNTKASFDLSLNELSIGRDPNCSLSINSPSLSRRHAVIGKKWGHFTLTDLASKNGTFVNGLRITETAIKDGDEIVFGTVKSIFKNPQEFDIGEISKTISESKENEAAKEAQKAAKKADETSSQIVKPKSDDGAISDAAMISAGNEPEKKPSPQETKKETAKETEKKSDKAKLEKSEKEKEAHEVPAKKTPPPAQNKSFYSSFGPTEWALFGFGALVIVGVLIALAAILV